MDPGTDAVFTFNLMKSASDNDPCVVEQTVNCECPCKDPGGNYVIEGDYNWLNVEVYKNSAYCGPYFCNVVLSLNNVPECYTWCKITDGSGALIYQGTTANLYIDNICISKGFEKEYSLLLYEGENDPEPCLVKGIAYCAASTPIEPCKPDCPNDEFVMPPFYYQASLNGCPNCDMIATYTYRKACGKWQDLQILGIEIKCASGTDRSSCSDEEVYRQAIAGIINDNVMGFEPFYANDPCSKIYRVVSASCWASWEAILIHPETGEHINVEVIEPCESDCCMRKMEVCRGANGVTITDLGSLINQPSCWGITKNALNGTTIPCEGTCDWLENITDYVGRKSILNEGFFNETHSINKNSIYVKLNVQNTETSWTLWIDETNGKELSIVISNISGKVVKSENHELTSGLQSYNIDKSELPTGTYVFNILIDGSPVKTGKFNVVR